jgi:flagellar hook-basal body complex protein FliE
MIDATSASSIQSMLETIRQYQTQAKGVGAKVDVGESSFAKALTSQSELTKVNTAKTPSFIDSVKNLVDQVNDQDVKADALGEAYQRGEDVPLTDVVLSMQKASLSFEATLQVRNKVVKAYEEIMNMPV